MLSPVLVTPPTPPVTLAEAKAHLRIEPSVTDEDALIQSLVGAVFAHIDGPEGTLGRGVSTQVWSQEYDHLSGDVVLPIQPVQSVTGISHDGVTFAGFRLLNDYRGHFIRPNDGANWPSNDGPVTVTFTAGYASTPAPIKAAMLLHIATLYEYRETMVENVRPSRAYESLLAPYRAWLG